MSTSNTTYLDMRHVPHGWKDSHVPLPSGRDRADKLELAVDLLLRIVPLFRFDSLDLRGELPLLRQREMGLKRIGACTY